MPTAASSNAARTFSQVAEELNVRDHHLEYVVLKFGIKEAFRAGHYRMYTDEQVEQIRRHLRTVKSRRLIAD